MSTALRFAMATEDLELPILGEIPVWFEDPSISIGTFSDTLSFVVYLEAGTIGESPLGTVYLEHRGVCPQCGGAIRPRGGTIWGCTHNADWRGPLHDADSNCVWSGDKRMNYSEARLLILAFFNRFPEERTFPFDEERGSAHVPAAMIGRV